MILYTKIQQNQDPRSGRAYVCAACGTVITYSDAMIRINGMQVHSFLNPAGLRCNFKTFNFCEHVLVHEQLYLEHSWFPGYGWRFLICSGCHQHLGWKYDAVDAAKHPEEFFGVMLDAVQEQAGGH